MPGLSKPEDGELKKGRQFRMKAALRPWRAKRMGIVVCLRCQEVPTWKDKHLHNKNDSNGLKARPI
jgi:hypothetical protein